MVNVLKTQEPASASSSGQADASLLAAASPAFEDDFTGRTMRLDYHHSGTATEEPSPKMLFTCEM